MKILIFGINTFIISAIALALCLAAAYLYGRIISVIKGRSPVKQFENNKLMKFLYDGIKNGKIQRFYINNNMLCYNFEYIDNCSKTVEKYSRRVVSETHTYTVNITESNVMDFNKEGYMPIPTIQLKIFLRILFDRISKLPNFNSIQSYRANLFNPVSLFVNKGRYGKQPGAFSAFTDFYTISFKAISIPDYNDTTGRSDQKSETVSDIISIAEGRKPLIPVIKNIKKRRILKKLISIIIHLIIQALLFWGLCCISTEDLASSNNIMRILYLAVPLVFFIWECGSFARSLFGKFSGKLLQSVAVVVTGIIVIAVFFAVPSRSGFSMSDFDSFLKNMFWISMILGNIGRLI